MNIGAGKNKGLQYRAVLAGAGALPPQAVPVPVPEPEPARPATRPLDVLEGVPLPSWMAEWEAEDAADAAARRASEPEPAPVPVPPPGRQPFAPVFPEEPPAPEQETHILSLDQIFPPEKEEPPPVVAVTKSHPISEEFREELDRDIERLMERTKRFLKPDPEPEPAPPPPSPAPAAPAPRPAFEMPEGALGLFDEKPVPVPAPAFEDLVVDSPPPPAPVAAIEAATPPTHRDPPKKPASRPPQPAYEPPSMTSPVKRPSTKPAVKDGPPPRGPQGLFDNPFGDPAAAKAPASRPGGGKVRDTARRVRRALTPILQSTLGPSHPWLSLAILTVGVVWITAGAALGIGVAILVGFAFVVPVTLAAALRR